MNPPFSKANEMFKHFFKVVHKDVAIYRSDNLETKLWQDIILKNATWIFIFNKRIEYENQKGKGARLMTFDCEYKNKFGECSKPVDLTCSEYELNEVAIGYCTNEDCIPRIKQTKLEGWSQ